MSEHIQDEAIAETGENDSRFWFYVVVCVAAWTALNAISFTWSLSQHKRTTLAIARYNARFAFDDNLVYRRWEEEHVRAGAISTGISVPDPAVEPARPDLNEDLRGHLVALNPVDESLHVSDPWEKHALAALAKGSSEFSAVTEINGKPYMRLMRPVIAQQRCLVCHKDNKVGDLRGGVTLSIPLEKVAASTGSEWVAVIVVHAVFFVAGLIGIFLAVRTIYRRIQRITMVQRKIAVLNKFLQRVIDNIPDSMTVIDLDRNIILANQPARDILDGDDPVARKMKCYELSHGTNVPCTGADHPCPFDQVLSTGQLVTVEHVHYTAAGEKMFVEISAAPVFGETGEIERVIEYARDVTVRVRFEKTLRESESKFRALFESSTDAIMLLDETGFFDCNEATLKMFGFDTRDEFVKHHPADLSPPTQPDGTDSVTAANSRIATAMKEGSCRFEWTYKRTDGTEFSAEVLLNAMEIKGKTVLQAVVRDVSERKRIEAELVSRLREIEEFNRMAVGRELSMIRLKQEINMLLNDLGKPAKYDIVE